MIKSYLINLTKDTDRLASFRQQFDDLGLEFERISAVDGRETSQNDYEAFQRDRPRGLTKGWLRGQMGCFLSHYAAWEIIANGEDSYCAVFEDDIYLSAGLRPILSSDTWVPESVDVIRLEPSSNRVKFGRSKLVSLEERNFFRVLSTSYCTGAYLISRKAARRLVSLAPEHHQPADIMLFSFEDSAVTPSLGIFQCQPAPCIQDKFLNPNNQRFSSNIESNSIKPGTLGAPPRLSLRSILGAIYRTLLNYRRVRYH